MSDRAGLKVLFLDSWHTDRSRGSGSAVAIQGLASGIEALGHSVTFLRPRWRLPAPAGGRILANVGFRARARRHDADLLIGFDFDGFLTAPDDTPYVVCLKGVMADEARYETGWSRIRHLSLARLEKWNARRAGRVLVTSQHSRRVAIAAYGLDPEITRVVPEGISVSDWQDRTFGGLPADRPPVILSVARQYRRKNTSTLIRAMIGVLREVPDARLRVVGDGPEMGRLEQLVRSLGLADSVTFLGALEGVDAVRDEMARARVFCLPSRQEGFGIVFLEAMAAGLPIVAARCGAVPETAPHGEVALLVDPDDVEELASALVRILRDADLSTRLARGGNDRWLRFDWSAIAERFLAEVGRS